MNMVLESSNIPQVKLGIIAVSRDCFPIKLAVSRREAIVTACAEAGLPVVEVKTAVESEADMEAALAEAKAAGVNALTVFLGNFGPETPETLIAQRFDATNPETRDYVWRKLKKNYADYGIDMFWLDNAEPDYAVYDYDNYRYWLGTALEVTNIYPQWYSRIAFDNQVKEGLPAVNLLRSAWAGSQKYGNVVWSGDVPSTFEGFRDQFQCGINMAICGMPWWTTDIGGFMTDDVSDPYFQQLLIRWYEFAVYTPILRMHGDRGPYNTPNLDDSSFGGGSQRTGQPNELWSFGEKNFKIMRDYLDVRLAMKPYIKQLFDEAHETGAPLLRPMFYSFPADEKCWDLYDQYMFGDKLLVAPVLYEDMWEREVYLPAGTWKDVRDGRVYEGGQAITAAAPLESIPVFERQ